jgi:predicted AAA+ superfamily ATPase
MSKNDTRYLIEQVVSDLQRRKMVFLGGPRQVGKTTFAKKLLKDFNGKEAGYVSWDDPKDRPKLLRGEIPGDVDLVVLDEVHKYRGWRNLIKGIYDKNKDKVRFLVTGSARLDYYRRGGDSLQGRYFFCRLHPYSLNELQNITSEGQTADSTEDTVSKLFRFGGFPEPLFSEDERFHRRWNRERLKRVIQEDLIGLEDVEDISNLELLMGALPDRVASPLSMRSLGEDLQVSPTTIKRWLKILENLFYIFRIAPFGSPKIRAVKKEQKCYLWDWSTIELPGPRFENMVALQLLKYCHYIEDTEGYDMELRYIRDTDKREVDFVVIKDKKPLFAVEAKLKDENLSPHIKYFAERTSIPEFFQVHLGKENFKNPNYRAHILPLADFVKLCNMP